MANEQKNPNLILESEIPESWQDVEAKPIIPGETPAAVSATPSVLPPYFRGSIPAALQHDVYLVGTDKNPRVTSIPIMPTAPSANPQNNAAISSVVIKSQAATAAASVPSSDIESIATNLQTGTTYTINLSDRNTLISLSNNAGGTLIIPSSSVGAAFVQITSVAVGTNSASVSMTNGQGNLLIVVVKTTSSATHPVISDTNGNVYNFVGSAFESNGAGIFSFMFYAFNVKGGTNIVTSTLTGNNVIQVSEYSGMPAIASLDQFAGNGQFSPIQTPSITTGVPNALVVAHFILGTPNGAIISPGNGWTQRYNDATGSRFVEDRFVANSGTTITGTTATPVTEVESVNLIASFASNGQSAGVIFPVGWFCYIENTGTGTFTISGSGVLIDGQASVSLGSNKGVLLVFDGTSWHTVRGTGASGAPTTDTFVLGTQDAGNLPNSVANPSVYYGPDAQPASAGSLDDEFAGSSLNIATRWTWVNQGSATATVSKSILFMTSPAHAGTNIEYIYQTAPSTPWQVDAKIAFLYFSNNNAAITGLVLSDGTGKIILFGLLYNAGLAIDVVRYTNPTTFSFTPFSNSSAQANNVAATWVWLRVKDDGVNVIYSISIDGVNYFQMFSESRTAFLLGGPTRVGLAVDAENGSSAVSQSCDYFRRTL